GRAPGQIGPGHWHTLDRAGDAIAPRCHNRERIDDRVQYDRARCGPIHQTQEEHGDKPDEKRAPKAQPQAVLLRQSRVLSANSAQASFAMRLPTALCEMNCAECSSARMIMAAPPAVGSAAINDPMKGPLRSTTTEAVTTIEAVIAIFSASPYQKAESASAAVMALPAPPVRKKRREFPPPAQTKAK